MMLSKAIERWQMMTLEDYKKEFENMTYEELSEIYTILSAIKKEKYRKSEHRKQVKAQINKKYRDNNKEKVKEQRHRAWKKYKENNRERISAYNIEYQRKRRIKRRREEIEKNIALSGEVATKHTNTSCVFDVSQLWNTYEHDYS